MTIQILFIINYNKIKIKYLLLVIFSINLHILKSFTNATYMAHTK